MMCWIVQTCIVTMETLAYLKHTALEISQMLASITFPTKPKYEVPGYPCINIVL